MEGLPGDSYQEIVRVLHDKPQQRCLRLQVCIFRLQRTAPDLDPKSCRALNSSELSVPLSHGSIELVEAPGAMSRYVLVGHSERRSLYGETDEVRSMASHRGGGSSRMSPAGI